MPSRAATGVPPPPSKAAAAAAAASCRPSVAQAAVYSCIFAPGRGCQTQSCNVKTGSFLYSCAARKRHRPPPLLPPLLWRRQKGFIPLSTYLTTYKLGDYVDIKVNAAVHKVRALGRRADGPVAGKGGRLWWSERWRCRWGAD